MPFKTTPASRLLSENGTDVNITSTKFGQSTTMAATNAAASARNVQLRVQINF